MKKYHPDIHHRRSIRLKGYDYAQAGLYYLTICCQDRACLFGNIIDGNMHLNDAGKMVEAQWLDLSSRFANIKLHEYIIMPNHLHAILEIVGATLVVAQNDIEMLGESIIRVTTRVAPTNKTIGDIMDAFKSISTVEYVRGVKMSNWPSFNGRLWQRNYYEHIIRNEQSYQTISEYIVNNPTKWSEDRFFMA